MTPAPPRQDSKPSASRIPEAATPVSASGGAWWLALLQSALLGVVYAVLSTPAAFTANDNTLAAIIWPAPAIAAAWLWRLPYRQWPPFLIAVFVAMLFVGNFDALSVGADSAFAVLNVFQVALYSWAGRRFINERGEIDTTRKLARFMVLLALLCTGVIAGLGATIGAVTKHTFWLDEWRVMMVGNGLAILVLLPALLAWCPADRRAQARDEAASFAWTPTIAAALSAAVFVLALFPRFPAELLRALLSLVLVWAAIHGGLKAASSGLLVAAALGIGLTFVGLGPYASPTRSEGIWDLQLDLAGLAVLSFFVAITVYERQKLNRRLDSARRFESMGLLAGGIAHDFNNILGAVGGYTELANEQLANEKSGPGSAAQGSLREAALAVARGKDLTEQILLAGRRGERARERIDFRDIVLQATSLARPLLPAGIELSVSVPLAGVPVLAHEGQVVRALLNLVRNASQAASQKVNVTLTIAPQDTNAMMGADQVVGEMPEAAFAWVDVTDDGSGIPPAHMHQLFDPFFSSRAAGGKGTGLGLAIVAGVATDHAGGVAVWSGHGAATRFRFMLPLAADAASGIEPSASGQGQTVLLLEPDEELRECEENLLAELGFEPLGFAQAEDALAALEQSPGDFLLFMTSEDFTSRVTAMAPSLPVIAYTQEPHDSASISQAGRVVSLPANHDLAALHKAVTMATGATPGAATQTLTPSQSL
ncbi:MAG: MASE1 domain-containing protein [Polaromonas sp.]|uniref:ATP-binding protein n=1 Tax=Polaromonas sp. TaxID=1869339 RepID=UPI0025EA7846|nr:MASE1 domain-containing protein [Polaromonas sp.]MBI2727063.1 MASE1 domain-containing protein [Polaromonas sp.]